MRKLYVYAHTHWDREWYQPFESFRLQLVSVVRQVLDDLESGALPRFYLDGQSIIFDDVTELAPELRPRLEANMRSGRLSAGPWYVLADQMLVGGESLVRNLSIGMKDTALYGSPALVGYCPDTFGHSQDMPRIFNGFGIKTAVVWRGVPLLQMGPLFWWMSPDGSRVLTYHLTHGYYQTAFHDNAARATAGGADACDPLVDTLLPWVDMSDGSNGNASSYYKPIDGALMPVGADHVGPPPRFSELLKQLNARLQKRSLKLKVVPTSLSEFMEIVSQRAHKQFNVIWGFDGELRSNRAAAYYRRAYLLYGVLSTRLYLKRANRLAEHRLCGLVEPFLSILRANGLAGYPEQELNYAWRLLLRNHPHDSICGCSVDAVHDEMTIRYAKLDQLLDALILQAQRSAVAGACPPGLAAEDPDSGCRRLLLINTSLYRANAPVPVRWYEHADSKRASGSPFGQGVAVQVERREKVDQLFGGFGMVPYYKDVELVEGYVHAGPVPPLGAVLAGAVSGGAIAERATGADTKLLSGNFATAEPVVVRSHRLSNGLLEVNISSAGRLTVTSRQPDGTVQIYKIHHQIVDVGDAGDSYNFDPIPDDKPIAARPVDAAVTRKGPLLGSITLNYEIDIPESAVADSGFLSRSRKSNMGKIEVLKRSAKKIKHRIATEITLKSGVPIVFFDTAFENRASDHRLRVLFDTETSVQDTFSENHFSVVHRVHGPRSRKAEKLPVQSGFEALPDSFPCQRFFIANGQLFLNNGLPEYAVEDNQVAITLLRAVSFLSRPQLFTRGGGAGPNLPVPGANCFGDNKASYGWAPLPGPRKKAAFASLSDEAAVAAYELAGMFEGSLWAMPVPANSSPGLSSLVAADNPAISLRACFVEGSNLVLRLLNVTMSPQAVRLRFAAERFASVALTDMSGRVLRNLTPLSGELGIEFERNQLLTLQFSLI